MTLHVSSAILPALSLSRSLDWAALVKAMRSPRIGLDKNAAYTRTLCARTILSTPSLRITPTAAFRLYRIFLAQQCLWYVEKILT